MTTRWWIAVALAVGTTVAVAADFAQGQYGSKGGRKGGTATPPLPPKGVAWGSGSTGPTPASWAKAQTAARLESAAKLQSAQSDARRLAAQNRGPVANVTPRPETPLDEATALAAVITANGGKIPATGEELRQALALVGDFAQLPVPFSAVTLDSGLANPRVILAPRGGRLDPAAVNLPAVAGRLFLAANLEMPAAGDPRVRSVEFISWNARRARFDFGVIEDLGGDPQVRLLDGVRCFSCHKNRGPILGVGPWSNSAHNDVVRSAVELALLPLPGVVRGGPPGRADGMVLFAGQAAEVDAAVRMGANIHASRDGFRLLSRDAHGRKALVAFLVGVVTLGNMEKIDSDTAVVANSIVERQFPSFVGDWVALRKAEKPSRLHDFSPAGSVGSGGGAWSGGADLVGRYDVGRILGNHKLGGLAHPSNPNAFVRAPVKPPTHASQIVNTVSLARAIGISEGDRAFLGKSLADAAKRVRTPKVTAAALARQVFEGPHFRAALEGGALPDREDFKERFVRGLDEVLRASHGVADGFTPFRESYASGPVYSPPGRDEPEPRVLPTTACLRCHEVRGEGRAKFAEPLPALAFDPFDRNAREVWLKGASRVRKQEVLARMLQRVAVSKDMPPEDEPEHEHFRVNDPAAFDEVRLFLEAALKDAKGK